MCELLFEPFVENVWMFLEAFSQAQQSMHKNVIFDHKSSAALSLTLTNINCVPFLWQHGVGSALKPRSLHSHLCSPAKTMTKVIHEQTRQTVISKHSSNFKTKVRWEDDETCSDCSFLPWQTQFCCETCGNDTQLHFVQTATLSVSTFQLLVQHQLSLKAHLCATHWKQHHCSWHSTWGHSTYLALQTLVFCVTRLLSSAWHRRSGIS